MWKWVKKLLPKGTKGPLPFAGFEVRRAAPGRPCPARPLTRERRALPCASGLARRSQQPRSAPRCTVHPSFPEGCRCLVCEWASLCVHGCSGKQCGKCVWRYGWRVLGKHGTRNASNRRASNSRPLRQVRCRIVYYPGSPNGSRWSQGPQGEFCRGGT